jgi:tetratricopeptide (TPR) repeat protein
LKSIKAVPKKIVSESESGLFSDTKGQLTDAKTAIPAALNLKSNDARILYHAGMIEKDLGNRAGAKKMLEAALKINPMVDLLQAENARRVLSELK